MLRRIWLISFLSVAAAAQDSFVVRDVRLFDGEKVIPRTSIVVRGGIIRAIQSNVASEPSLSVIDGTGKTLMPGLIDAHAHVFAFADLKQALAFGVTTELDMFGSPDLIAAWKQLERQGKTNGMADVRFAGIGANAPGGRDFDSPVPTIRGPQEAEAFVDARLAEGSDYIKIIYNSGVPAASQTPAISRETMAALIAAAHRRGKLALVHIGLESAAREALAAGGDGLAHLFTGASAEPGFGALAKLHGAFVVPTLSVLTNVCGTNSGVELAADSRVAPYLLPLSAQRLNQSVVLRRGRQQPSCEGLTLAIRQLLDAGVPILAGTDVGNAGLAHGASVHGEMSLLAARGLTPVQALASATSVAADAFRLQDRGRIVPGKRADLLLVSGDPTQDLSATRNISAIWKQGHRFDREAFRAEIPRIAVPDVPPGSTSGLVSDFDGKTVSSKFGTPWRAFDGVQMKLVPGGANGTSGSLLVVGEVEADRPPYLWPGIEFVPSGITRSPANLSSKRGISFWAKGDGKSARVAIISERGRQEFKFAAGSEWQHFQFDFTKSADFDPAQFLYLIFAAAPQPGHFEFQIDEVAFY